MTEKEALAVAFAEHEIVKPVNDILMIDPETRTINVPDSERLFGVQSDEKGERKYFRCKRFVGNGIDLSKLSLRIVFQNASGLDTGKDKYIVTDLATDVEDYITFSWELSRKVTAYKGIISFVVCAIKTNSDGTITNEWNTTLANGEVLEGLEANGTQEQEQVARDYYNQLEAELLKVANEQKTELEKKAQEVIETIPSDYTQMQKDVDSLKEGIDKALPNGYAKIGTFEAKWEQQGINDDGTIANVTNAASVGKINILNIPTSFKLVSKDNGYKFNVCEFSKNGDEYIFKKSTEINGVAQAEFNAGFYKIGFFDITESPLDYYNMSESDRVKLVESHYELYFNKLPFTAYSEFEKPFVIFSFDWYSDSWQKYQIMKPLGLNATFCLDTQTSDYNISDGLTRSQFNEMLENGWDWALYGTIGDRGNTKDSWKAAISAGLKQKENMGIFNPVMYNTPDNNSAEYITEACKELGFLMQRCFINGENYIRSRTQYRTGANYLTNASIDNCKAYVEKAISNKCGVCFYTHNMSDTSDLSESNFKKFIEYIAQKVKKGEIEVLSAREYASKYLTDQLILNDYKASIKQGAFLHKLIN